jgi:hypothetical protein
LEENFMSNALRLMIVVVGIGVPATVAIAQAPDEPGNSPRSAPKEGAGNKAAVNALVARMMEFDKNKDGKLTRDEVTDRRMLRMFDRADANKDGVVTKEELVAWATKLVADEGGNGGRRRRFDFPRMGAGGPGGFGPPQPGQIMPRILQEELKLTDDQKQQVAALQKEVDEKLEKLLTDEQKQQLKELRQRMGRGPGGRRPGGPGRGGPPGDDGPPGRGPGGPPPDEPGPQR